MTTGYIDGANRKPGNPLSAVQCPEKGSRIPEPRAGGVAQPGTIVSGWNQLSGHVRTTRTPESMYHNYNYIAMEFAPIHQYAVLQYRLTILCFGRLHPTEPNTLARLELL